MKASDAGSRCICSHRRVLVLKPSLIGFLKLKILLIQVIKILERCIYDTYSWERINYSIAAPVRLPMLHWNSINNNCIPVGVAQTIMANSYNFFVSYIAIGLFAGVTLFVLLWIVSAITYNTLFTWPLGTWY